MVEPTWAQLADAAAQAAMKVFGQQEPVAQRPWLQGREEEMKQLSYAITTAKEAVHLTLQLPEPLSDTHREMRLRAKTLLRKANKKKRTKLNKWEQDWWKQLGTRAEEANKRGDSRELYAGVSDDFTGTDNC